MNGNGDFKSVEFLTVLVLRQNTEHPQVKGGNNLFRLQFIEVLVHSLLALREGNVAEGHR